MFSYKINYTNIFFIFLVYITMSCANLAYLTRNPFRFFECFPNFSRTLPERFPIFNRNFSSACRIVFIFSRMLLECSRKSFVLFPSFPEIFRVFSDFSRMLPKTFYIFSEYIFHMWFKGPLPLPKSSFALIAPVINSLQGARTLGRRAPSRDMMRLHLKACNPFHVCSDFRYARP